MKTTKHFLGRTDLSRRSVSSLILACLVAMLSGSMGLCADDTGKKAAPKTDKARISSKAAKSSAAKAAPQAAPSTNKVVVTGSHIPRGVTSQGRANAISSPVYIVDRKEIERSGAMTTADLLRRLPFAR